MSTHSLRFLGTGQAPQQQNPAQGDQTEHDDVQQDPPSDQMQRAVPLCHETDHDYIHLAEGIALAALTEWHEQSCLQIWWLLSGTGMVVLNAVSLAINISSMDGFSSDQWQLVHTISAVVLSGYFGILSGQIYGMCLVRSVQLFAVHNKFAALHCAGPIDLRRKAKVTPTSRALPCCCSTAGNGAAMATAMNQKHDGFCAG